MTAKDVNADGTLAPIPLPRGATRPFSLFVSLSRNPLRTIPMLLTVCFASISIVTVVMLANSITSTVVAPNDFLRGAILAQPGKATLEEIDAFARTLPETAGTVRVRTTTVRGRFLDLQMWFPILLVPDGTQADVLRRYGGQLAAGRYPAPGTLEVVVPTVFAKGRGVAIGDVLGGPDDFTPMRLVIVGLTEGPRWIGLGASSGVPQAAAVAEGLIAFGISDDSMPTLERKLSSRFGDAIALRHWSADTSGTGSADYRVYRGDLRLLLSFIVAMNAAVLAVVGALLALLYFRQRLGEFVLLSVLGRSTFDLVRFAVGEIVVVGAGWLVGLGFGFALMRGLDAAVLSGRGVAVRFDDPDAALYTLPMALSTILVSGLVIALGLVRLDPVQRLRARA